MKTLMKIPFYIPFLGIVFSFILFIIAANYPNTIILISALILFFASGWFLIIRFFLGVYGFFGTILDSK
ncbi:MAG TPA: hypothetical protein PKZ43_07945 [Bacteroidales bacterium]|nr:hypothetical protein [Bacteroidales bacterium]HQH19473.1 hypothetical protein [Bacteroidales bacterium]